VSGRELRASVAREWRGIVAVGLSRLFRYGTAALVVLAAFSVVSWWLALIPVVPVWCSFVMGTHEAYGRARIIQRPKRPMSLDEAASERRFLLARASWEAATADRKAALGELARARTQGEAQAQARRQRERARALVDRSRPPGGPP
jgi:hypothetical protein